MIDVFILLIFAVVAFFNVICNSPYFRGFFQLPKPIDQLVYSFFYTEEHYPDPKAYNLSEKSRLYSIYNPKDYVKSSILYIPSDNATSVVKPLLIFFRGNGAIQYRMSAIKGIQSKVDVDVAVVNYRGSFEELSRDQVSRFKIRSDNRAAMRFIRQHFHFEQYFVYGLSIGSAICSDFVLDDLTHYSDARFRGVILDNVFTSLASSFQVNVQTYGETSQNTTGMIALNAVKWAPWAVSGLSNMIVGLCGETYNNVTTWTQIKRKVASSNDIECPLLVFSSGNDKIMNPEDGQTIAKIMPTETTTYVLVEGADHGSCSDYPIFYEEIARFITNQLHS
jgi:hypothetical protein